MPNSLSTEQSIVRDPIVIVDLMRDAVSHLSGRLKRPEYGSKETDPDISNTINVADLASDLSLNLIFAALDIEPATTYATCVKVVMSLYAQKLITVVSNLSAAAHFNAGSPLWVELITPEKAREIKGKISALSVVQYLVENPDEKHRENGYTVKELSDILLVSTPSIYARARELDEEDGFIELVQGENAAMSRVVRIPNHKVSAKKIS